jgi:hypothetical protein
MILIDQNIRDKWVNLISSILEGNQKINYGWKFKEPGIIYRLKDFK